MIRKLRILLRFPIDFWQMIITYFPGTLGRKLRYWFWKRRLKSLGKNIRIDAEVCFQNPQFISIDDNCWIDKGVIVLAGPDRSSRPRHLILNDRFPHERGMVYIGKNVHIGPYCVISGIGGVHISDECGISSGVKVYSFTHHYRSNKFPSDRGFYFSPLVKQERQYMIEGPIFLDRSVGVALNAIILPGVSIGKDSFVAINSVVMSSFEENSLIAGHPAKRIKKRFKDG
jgi:acetyltransferase-like isoleucine patch superfamily enzyme